MKNKFFTVPLALTMAVACSFGVSACEHTHKYGELLVVTRATCEEAGLGVRTCKSCDNQITEELPALGHDIVTIGYKAATCGEDGHNAYEECLRNCGYSTKAENVIPATREHEYDENNICKNCKTPKTVYHYEISDDGNYCTFTGVSGLSDKYLEIAESFNDVPVTVIGAHALEGCQIDGVTIPESVIIIEDFAFNNCHLKSVTIPQNVQTIGELAFAECDFTEVIIPDSVVKISSGAFFRCTQLEKVSIPNNIQSIEGGVFEDCESLVPFTNDEGNVYFLGNEDNQKLVLIGADDTVENLQLDEETIIIYGDALNGCKNLKSVTIPDTVRELGIYIFQDCENLESVVLPSALEKIPNGTFNGCVRLVDVQIPETVTEICDSAFENCKSLDSIIIPSNVTKLGNNAFAGCGIDSNDPDYAGEEFKGRGLKEVIFRSNNGTSIGDHAFAFCYQLKSVILPEGLITIEYGFFEGCQSLEWVYIPESVQEIQDYAFGDCYNLAYIYYNGTTARQWESISISEMGNVSLEDKVYFYSPATPVVGGRYWWWGGPNGEPVAH